MPEEKPVGEMKLNEHVHQVGHAEGRTWVRRARLFAGLALVVALVSLISGGRASGDPIDDQRAQAKALQDQIDANGVKIDALSEQYNGAQYRLEQAQAAVADAQQKLDATRADVARGRRRRSDRDELCRTPDTGRRSASLRASDGRATSDP
jgi:multidrug resistance efflux pump